MRSDETGAAGDQYALALRWGQELNGREARESRVGDRVGVWMEYGLGLIRGKILGRLCVLPVLTGDVGGAWGGRDIVRAKIKGSEEIDGDFTVEAKPIEANGFDFLSRLVQNFDLSR